MQTILQEFEDLGLKASFHYADDSGQEWSQARSSQHAAELLFVQHPELREEMCNIARGFLWSLNPERLLKQQ